MHFLANIIGQRALVLKEKTINLDGPCYIRLVGRKGGLISWLLTLIGINTTSVLEVYADRIEYSHGSLSGCFMEIIPLSKVSNLLCGRLKPVIQLYFAIASLYLVYRYHWLFLILTLCFVASYFLKKTTLISVIPHSGSQTSIAFKRSIIENKVISDEEAMEIIKMVSLLVENATNC